jgi:hypothetical protein
MPNTRNISSLIFGVPLDPFSTETRRHIALVAFLAWRSSSWVQATDRSFRSPEPGSFGVFARNDAELKTRRFDSSDAAGPPIFRSAIGSAQDGRPECRSLPVLDDARSGFHS